VFRTGLSLFRVLFWGVDGHGFFFKSAFFVVCIFASNLEMGNNFSFWDPANRKVEINGIVFYEQGETQVHA